MGSGNVDQGDSCHGHRKIACQPVRTLGHTWTVNAVGAVITAQRSDGFLLLEPLLGIYYYAGQSWSHVFSQSITSGGL